jgi:hypothetical protein
MRLYRGGGFSRSSGVFERSRSCFPQQLHQQMGFKLTDMTNIQDTYVRSIQYPGIFMLIAYVLISFWYTQTAHSNNGLGVDETEKPVVTHPADGNEPRRMHTSSHHTHIPQQNSRLT